MQRLISFLTVGLLLVLLSATELLAAPPTTQASNLAFSAITTTSVRILFNKGNGDSRIVVIKAGGAPADPTDGQAYSNATANYSATPAQTAAGSKVVYANSDRNVIVTGLTPGTEYTVEVFERNGTEYKIGGGLSNPRSFFTNPAQPASVGAGSHQVTNTSFRANWTNPASGGWDAFVVTVSKQADFSSALNWYNNTEVAGNEITVEDVNSAPALDITPNTTYYYRVRTVQGVKMSDWVNGPFSGITTLPLNATIPSSAVSVCLGDTYILTPTGPDPGEGTEQHKFKVWSAANGGSPLYGYPLLSINITPSSQGTTTYWVSAVSNKTGLESATRVQLQITANPSGPSANAGSDITTCGVTPYTYTLTGNNPSPAQGMWTQISGPGTAAFDDYEMYNSDVDLPNYGTYVFRWTITQNGCATTYDEVSITLTQPPTPAVITPAADVCGSLTTTITGNTPTSGIGTWTYTSANGGTATFSPNANSPVASVSVSQPDQYTFTWTTSNGSCSSSSTSDVVVFDATTTVANAGADDQVCGSLGYAFAGNMHAASETGVWTLVSGPGTANFGGTQNDYNASVTVSTSGTYVFKWKISSQYGVCPSSEDNVSVMFSPQISTAIADAGTITCGDMTVMLNATAPVVGNGMWSVLSGPAGWSFDDESLNDANFTITTFGSYTLRWTVTDPNGICPPSTDDITLGFDQLPTPADAGFAQNVCGLTANLAGNAPSVGMGTWSKDAGPGFVSFTDENSNNSQVTVDTYGAYSFEWKIESSCGTSADYVNITFWNDMTTPALSAGTDFAICGAGNTSMLNGTDPVTAYGIAPNSGQWTKISGPGVVTFENGTSMTDYDAEISFNLNGTYVMRWTVSNGPCVAYDEVTINVDDPPTVTFGAIGGTHCTTENAFTLTTGSPSGGVYTGTGVSGGQFDPSVAGAGTHTLTYTYSNGNCSSYATATVVVTNPVAVTWTNSYGPVCVDASSFSINNATPVGGTYSGAGVSGSTFNPATAGAGTHTITYSYTDGGCVSTKTKVIVVNALPTVTWSNNLGSHCVSESSVTLTGGSPASGTYSGTAVSGNNFNPSVAGVGTFTLTYTYSDINGCVNTATNTIIVISATTATFNAINPVCVGSSSFTLTTYVSPAGGTFSGSGVTGSNFDPSSVSPGTYTITYTVGSGGCTDSETQTVVVNALPTITWLTNYGPACQNSSDITLTDNSTFGATPYGGTYTGDGAGEVDGNVFKPSVAGPGTHTVTYSYTDANGCTNTMTKAIVVSELPVITWSNSYGPVCQSAGSFSIGDASTSVGTGSYSGPGVSGTMFSPSAAGPGTHTITYTAVNGACTETSTKVIVVNQQPVISWGNNYGPVCISASSFSIGDASTSVGTGSYSGPGVSGTTFNPASAGSGTHTITYTAVNGSCTETMTKTIVVNPLPTVTWSNGLGPVCVDGSSFALTGGSPASGNYSGPGVSAGNFNPSSAGTGTHTLTYTYTDVNGCTSTATNTIVVNAVVFANANDDDEANPGDLFYQLAGNVPSSGTGTWTKVSGPGTASFSNTHANNATVTVSAIGTYTFRWSIVNGACTNFDDVDITFSSGSSEAVKLDIQIPSGGKISGTAFNINVRSLDVNNNPVAPTSTVNFTVTVSMGQSTLSTTVTGSIVPPATSVSVAVTMNAPNPNAGEANVQLKAHDNANLLADGFSPIFNLNPSIPGNQATNLNFTSKTTESLSFNWTRGNGSGVVVVGKKSAGTIPLSVQLNAGNSYSAPNSNFGSGTMLAANTYVVYVGTGTNTTINGLDTRTKYAFKVFEFKGSAPLISYNNQDAALQSNNRSDVTLKGLFDPEEFPLVGENILSSSRMSPNPARDNVNLAIDLTESANVKIAFFTADGKQVLVPVDGLDYGAGRHSFNIPLKGLAAGVYSVVITANNEVIIDNVVVMP